jgi:Pentapeptide repeats (8 copies)
LQAYFNELSVLLIDKGLFEKLSGTIEDPTKEAMLSVITAKTRTMLKMFGEDIPRKAAVLLFLGDSSLLKQNLLNLNLSYVNLTKAYLAKADLSKAILLKADLTGANLLIANLNEAILTETILTDADLRGADLTGGILIKAKLNGAELNGANLYQAKLNGAELNGANLYQANLTGAIFEGAIDLTNEQIKSACFWDKAIYTEARWDNEKRTWVARDPQANEETIKKIRKYTASDPQTTPDCSIWNKTQNTSDNCCPESFSSFIPVISSIKEWIFSR